MNAHRLPSPDASARDTVLEDVADWIRQRGLPLASDGPDGEHAELAPLRDIVGDAAIVGLGMSTYGAHEQFTFGHRLVRFLVEELGFRAVATEEDWDVVLPIDSYVRTGQGDLDTMIKGSGVPWRIGEMRDAVEWIREYNATHDEPVRLVGVGVIDTRAAVYDEVTGYVERVAPDAAEALRAHFDVIRPVGEDYVPKFIMQVKDKEPYVEHAREALELVAGLPHAEGDAEHDLIVQHVRQIVFFYEHYAHHLIDDGYRDAKMAENLVWWHRHTGEKIVYWSTNAHSVRSDGLTISVPPRGTIGFKPTGGHLGETFGDRYVSIGITFDHGEINSGWSMPPFTSRPIPAPVPGTDFAERPFVNNSTPRYLLDLRADAPATVREWLNGPAKARVVGSICDPSQPDEHYMTGGSYARWYDAVVHQFRVTPSQAL